MKKRRKICITCGNNFYIKNSHYKLRKRCSRKCRATGTITNNGYKLITVEGKQIQEHRYVYQQFLGRKLERREIIHHKNHDKLDNRIENLQLTTYPEHKKIHSEIGKKTRFKRRIFLQRSKLVEMYKDLGSYAKVGRLCNCSEVTIRRIIKRNHKSYVKK